MTHVVILGAGIAGVSAAYALKAQLGPRDEVTVVSDKPFFHFVPSNPWVATGWRERSDIAFPIGPYLESRGIKFIHSGVKRIQPDVIQVDLENGDVLFYDYLLIATGANGPISPSRSAPISNRAASSSSTAESSASSPTSSRSIWKTVTCFSTTIC